MIETNDNTTDSTHKTLADDERSSLVVEVETLIGDYSTADVVRTLLTLTVSEIHKIEDKAERNRSEEGYIQALRAMSAIKAAQSEPETPEDNNFANDDFDGAIRSDDVQRLSAEMDDLCYGYTPDAILQMLPKLIDLFLEDRPKEKIDVVLLRAVRTCTYARPWIATALRGQLRNNKLKPLTDPRRRLSTGLNNKLKPLTDAITAISDKQERNALILELIDRIAGLGDYSDAEVLMY
jgi:hypothetical protein